MVKKTIEQIIGKDSFERLKKMKLNTAAAIKNTPPSQIMSVAGIGPVKAEELYKSVGKPIPTKILEAEYRKLQTRVMFQKVKSTIRETLEDPRKQIDKIENRRKEIILWDNMLRAGKNMTAEGDKRRPLNIYAPVSHTLDPFAMDDGLTAKNDMVTAEVFVTSDEGRVKVEYKLNSASENEVVSTDTEYIRQAGSVQMATELGQTLEDMYQRFKEKTLIGRFIVIFDTGLTVLYNAMQEKFRTEISAGRIALVPSKDEYLGWEALWKYEGNRTFEGFVKRFDKYYSYIQYEEEVSSGEKKDFEAWNSSSEKKTFWSIVRSTQESFIKLRAQNTKISFGIVKAVVKDIGDKQKADNIRVIHDSGYDSFVAAKREPPVKVGSHSINSVVLSFVSSVFDSFDIYVSGNTTIFMSTQLPEIGFIITKGGD